MNTKQFLVNSHKLSLFAFVAFTVLPVKINLSSIAIIVLACFGALTLLQERKVGSVLYFVLAIPLVVYIVGLINTENMDYASRWLTRNLSFVILPIYFFFSGKTVSQKMIDQTLSLFLVVLAALNFYLIYLFVYYFNYGERYPRIVGFEIYHATYLGMYNLFALWICLIRFAKAKFSLKSIYFWAVLWFAVGSVATSSRIIFIALFLSLLVFAILQLPGLRFRVISSLVLIGIGSLAITQVPALKEKFNQITAMESFSFDKDNYQSISSRVGKIEASKRLIANKPWMGAGTGDLIDDLVKEYQDFKFTMGIKERYNPHNQYLDNIGRNGLPLGILALGSLFVFPFLFGLRRDNRLLMALAGVVAITALTESVLAQHKGITFFAFFACLLIHQSLLKPVDQ